MRTSNGAPEPGMDHRAKEELGALTPRGDARSWKRVAAHSHRAGFQGLVGCASNKNETAPASGYHLSALCARLTNSGES